MLDLNWETINGSVAHQIEAANAANQANVLTCVIKFLLAHSNPGISLPPPPDESVLLMLHNAGTLLLLANPGQYRNIGVKVADKNGVVTHVPMDWQLVDGEMKNFFRHLHAIWQVGNAVDVAAYALWAINFIHPFRNGNGRTARAFSYACLCVKLGAEPPGTPNIVQLMTQEPYKSKYGDLLVEADKGPKSNQIVDLRGIKEFFIELLNIQVAPVVEASSSAASIQPTHETPDAPAPPT